ncbi:TAXI family TRAP transporter solute-binding subunit [Thermodesulfatator atlanticus]
MKVQLRVLVGCLFFLGLLLSFHMPANAKTKFITIGTGGVTGVYYPTGGAICRLMNKIKKQTGIRCTVESTGGSVYNVNMIHKGELDFGVAQSDVVYQAITGTGRFAGKPIKDIRVVMTIHPELMTLVVRKDSGINSFVDLKGKRINIGNPGSGQEATSKVIFEYCKDVVSLKDFNPEYLKAAECPNALRDRKIDGYFYMVGHPTANIKEAADSLPIKLISLDIPCIEKLVADKPYYAWGEIPAGMYKGVDYSVKTFGVKATIVTSKDMDINTVYWMTKVILDNFDKFKKMHPAYRHLTKKDLLKGFDHRWIHPGAAKAFKEEGLL